MITATVMAMGRTRSAAPSMIALNIPFIAEPTLRCARKGRRVIRMNDHHDTDFGRHAAKRNKAPKGVAGAKYPLLNYARVRSCPHAFPFPCQTQCATTA